MNREPENITIIVESFGRKVIIGHKFIESVRNNVETYDEPIYLDPFHTLATPFRIPQTERSFVFEFKDSDSITADDVEFMLGVFKNPTLIRYRNGNEEHKLHTPFPKDLTRLLRKTGAFTGERSFRAEFGYLDLTINPACNQ